MQTRTLHLLLGLVLLLTSCVTYPEDVPLKPTPRDIYSPTELPEGLASQYIYWQDHLITLDGVSVEPDSVTQLLDDLRTSGLILKFSHSNRYLAYVYKDFFSTIGLWDLETNERRDLINVKKEFAENATIGAIAFSPDDDKIFFDFTWHDDDGAMYADIATVDIATGSVEELNITYFQAGFHGLEISSDGKWAVTNVIAPDSLVCFLINLETRQLECINIKEGTYTSSKFALANTHIVYSYIKDITSPSSIMLSKIDGTKDKVLVSGLVRLAEIPIVTTNEIVFIGREYKDLACAYVYIINLDGSDLRKLSYLGGECSTNE